MAAKKDESQEKDAVVARNTIERSISDEMKEAYLDYAMSVITSRALPDVRDGLKPVHRRILYSMQKMGLTAGAKFKKSAAVVGDVLGKYHPHGDSAVYDSLVKMAQDFTFRYPLIIGQGNFGSIDGDNAAAMRYCVTGDTRVVTDKGLVSIKDLQEQKDSEDVEVNILSVDGKINKAVKWFDSGVHPTRTITTQKGYRLKGSDNHPVLTWREQIGDRPVFAWKLLEDVKEGDVVVIDRHSDVLWPEQEVSSKDYIPQKRCKKTSYTLPDTVNADVASLLGAFTAEGCVTDTKIEFANTDKEWITLISKQWGRAFPDATLHTFEKQAFSYGKKDYYRLECHVLKVIDYLANLGLKPVLSKDKRVPDVIFRSPKDVAAAFLSAYFEGDGTVTFSGKMNELSAISVSEDLLRDVQTLLLRFGIASTLRFDKHRDVYKLYIRGLSQYRRFQKTIGFVSKRKKVRLKKMIDRLTKASSMTDRIPFLSSWVRSLPTQDNGHYISRYNFDRYPNLAERSTAVLQTLAPHAELDVSVLFKKLLDNRYLFERVKSVKRTAPERVYSLKVDSECHSFVANGFVNHNTEAKMSKLSSELLADIEKDTVDFVDNYDGSQQEPSVLPAAVPNLLLNGTLGIAVGMATNIPPHNLSEVVDGLVHLIDDDNVTTESLMEYIKGPDFPLGATMFGKKDILHAYTNGRGGMLVRAEAEIVETKAGMFQIVVKSLPYRVNKENVIVKIAELVKEKKIEGIKDIRDESTRDIRIVIDLKTGTHPKKVLNRLYKYTQLEEKFHLNMVALVDGVPQTLSLKAVLEEYVSHRQIVVRRRAEYELRKAEAREHILLGLKKALDHIDEIIALIKKSKDREAAKANLMKEFKFSDLQADAILAMQLQRLAGLERKKIEDELKEIQKYIKELKTLLSSEKNILARVKEELLEIKEKYGDERRTRIMAHGVKDISIEDMIPDADSVLVYTAGGYVKRTDPSAYKRQRRGGVGVVDLDTKEEDFVTNLVFATLHSDMLFFTDKGRAYQIKMYDLPEGKRATKGKSIVNFLQLEDGERVTTILPMPKDVKNDDIGIMMTTKNGTVKKLDAASFHDVRRSGIIAISLKDDDELVSAFFVHKKDDVVLVSREGQSIRFKEADVREMGRTAQGVRGMKLKKGDIVVGGGVVTSDEKEGSLFVATENGYGKRTAITEYSQQNRGGSGLKTARLSGKTGKIVSAKIVLDEEAEVVAMSKKSQVIRLDIAEVPVLGRATQGVRIMKLRAGDSVASLICL